MPKKISFSKFSHRTAPISREMTNRPRDCSIAVSLCRPISHVSLFWLVCAFACMSEIFCRRFERRGATDPSEFSFFFCLQLQLSWPKFLFFLAVLWTMWHKNPRTELPESGGGEAINVPKDRTLHLQLCQAQLPGPACPRIAGAQSRVFWCIFFVFTGRSSREGNFLRTAPLWAKGPPKGRTGT